MANSEQCAFLGANGVCLVAPHIRLAETRRGKVTADWTIGVPSAARRTIKTINGKKYACSGAPIFSGDAGIAIQKKCTDYGRRI